MSVITQLDEQTRILSSLKQMRKAPAYVTLKSRGATVVQDLLKALPTAKSPVAFMMLLNEITNVDPVPVPDRGDVSKEKRAWLKWGERYK